MKPETEKLQEQEKQRVFFCVVSDAFRVFARRSSIALGSPWAFAGAVLAILVWVFTGPLFHFSDTWQLVINTATTIVTFLMVSTKPSSLSVALALDSCSRVMRNIVSILDLP